MRCGIFTTSTQRGLQKHRKELFSPNPPLAAMQRCGRYGLLAAVHHDTLVLRCANAVVGVDLDYVELSKAGSMVMLVASGTAVRIEE